MKTSHKGFIAPLLLVLVAILLIGGGAYMYARNKQSNQTAVVSPINQATSTTQTSNSQTGTSIVYTNTDFGFQITFPVSWAGKYKTDSEVTNGITSVSFLLPTSDKEWQNAHKNFPGYATIIGVNVWKLGDWNKQIADCKNASDNQTSCEGSVVGKTSQYVVTWFHPQDHPSDFAPYYVNGIDYLKQNFKALN